MKNLVSVTLYSTLLVGLLLSFGTQAEESTENIDADTAKTVSIDAKDGVTVNTGNETVDDAANLIAKCAEKTAALNACPGGLKGVACRKGIELGRYKGLECPNI